MSRRAEREGPERTCVVTRLGRTPEAERMRAASMTMALPAPLSVAPSPATQLSKCAPAMT